MITFQDIFAGYNKNVVLKDISFNIAENSFAGILGTNASGKTTLLKTILKILTPLKGEIFINKENLKNIALLDLAKKIAYVPQNTEIVFPLSVEEFLLLGRIPYKKLSGYAEKDFKILKEIISFFNLQNLSKKYFNTLSGGEKQKVIIAQSLMQQPKILILDEPTLHLDIVHQKEIMEILKNYNKNLTIICVLHDLNLAARYCSQIIFLKAGEIVAQGKLNEVFKEDILQKVFGTTLNLYYLNKKNYPLITLE